MSEMLHFREACTKTLNDWNQPTKIFRNNVKMHSHFSVIWKNCHITQSLSLYMTNSHLSLITRTIITQCQGKMFPISPPSGEICPVSLTSDFCACMILQRSTTVSVALMSSPPTPETDWTRTHTRTSWCPHVMQRNCSEDLNPFYGMNISSSKSSRFFWNALMDVYFERFSLVHRLSEECIPLIQCSALMPYVMMYFFCIKQYFKWSWVIVHCKF